MHHEKCPSCGSQDNLAVYGDNDYYCFTPRCSNRSTKNSYEKISTVTPLIKTIYSDLPSRHISKKTCEFMGYGLGHYSGNFKKAAYNGTVHAAEYYKDGQLTAQHLRTPDKRFKIIGNTENLSFWGQHKWPEPSDNVFLTICEGQIDALTLIEVCGTRFPVVSVPMGAQSLKKTIENNYKWVMGWKHVVVALDNDEAGVTATKDVEELFEPGKLYQARWDKKDPNDMLVDGLGEGKSRSQVESEIKQCLWNAKQLKPKQMVTIEDLLDEIIERPKLGEPFPWPTMTRITYGRRPGEIHIIVGATSIGKTEIVKDIIFQLIGEGINTALFSFEQGAKSTFQRMVGSMLKRKLHIPSDWWDEELIREKAKSLNKKLYCYNNKQVPKFNDIIANIRQCVKCNGVGLVVIDNLKALQGMSGGKNQVEHLTGCMLQFQELARELNITIILLSHISKDKMQLQTYVSTSPKNPEQYLGRTAEDMSSFINKPGLSWESGRMPTRENVEGSSAVCDLADYVWALARDTTNEDPDIQKTTRIKCLKSRLDGTMNGMQFKLHYGSDGILHEVE